MASRRNETLSMGTAGVFAASAGGLCSAAAASDWKDRSLMPTKLGDCVAYICGEG